MDKFNIINGNSLEVLKTLEENSVDSIITDPPYELGFMGKSWDRTGIAYNVELWKECNRVLKPGGYLLAFGGSRTYHRIACAIEDGGFEIRDTIMWLYGCYSKDTQVLTNKGWKYFYELDKTEKVLQWDKDTNKLSWIKPLKYFEYDINDEMVRLENRHTEQLLTKNHRVVCDLKKHHKEYNNKYNFIEAGNILKTDSLKLPLASYYYGDINYEYAYMVGWWLTDAWKHKDNKACMFSQSKPETLNKLRNELDRLKNLGKCDYSEYIKQPKSNNHNEEHTFYVIGEVADYLLTNFSNREFKEEFIELNKESKDLLLEGLIDGDGSNRKNSYSKVFWSQKDIRNDILSAMLTTMGYRNYVINNGNHKGVVFNIAHNTTEIQYKHNKENINYKGKVYCLQTETGAFVVRRNGKPFISGNSGFPKSMNIGKSIESTETLGNAGTRNKRIIEQNCGTEEYTLKQTNNGAMGEIIETTRKQYIPNTELSKKWAGWGTCLKPSFEPIVVARKPVEINTTHNVIKWGVGGINIDECRVGTEHFEIENGDYDNNENQSCFGNIKRTPKEYNGRFPANTILTYDETDFEEVCGGMPNTKSNEETKNTNHTFKGNKDAFKWGYKDRVGSGYSDEGSAARYFYCAKASKKDRDEGLDKLESKPMYQADNEHGNLGAFYIKKAGGEIGDVQLRKNTHPTVKPTSLMQYLVRLVSPKGATILDIFNGSGSTGKAVAYENLERNAGYDYIGIELDKEYCEISKARINYVLKMGGKIIEEERQEKEEMMQKKNNIQRVEQLKWDI